MRTSRSQRSRVSRRMPSPSAPSTHAIASGRFGSVEVARRLARPRRRPRSPAPSARRSVRARLVTAMKGTRFGRAARDLCDRGVEARARGPSARSPRARPSRRPRAGRRPRLCGSVTPSSTSSSAGSCSASSTSSRVPASAAPRRPAPRRPGAARRRHAVETLAVARASARTPCAPRPPAPRGRARGGRRALSST